MDLGSFLFHGNHRPQRVAKAIMTVLGAVSPYGKVAHGSLPGIEVTVPHEIARRIDRSNPEVMARSWLAILPEHHVTRSLSDDDHGSRTVAMKSAAAPRRKFRDVTTVGRVRKREPHMLDPFALHREIVQNKLIDVRDEIGFPITVGYVFVPEEKLLAFMKPVAKIERITKDKVFIVKNIDHPRTGGPGEHPHRLVPGTVEVLVRRIQRDSKDCAASPFKSYFRSSFLPYRSSTSSFDDIDDLFKEVTLR